MIRRISLLCLATILIGLAGCDVVLPASDECPPSSDLADYFPLEEGLTQEFDYSFDSAPERFVLVNESGVLTLTVDELACEDGIRTARLTKHITGTSRRFSQGETSEREFETSQPAMVITEFPDNRLYIDFEGPSTDSLSVPRYAPSGEDILLDPQYGRGNNGGHQLVLRAGEGIVSVDRTEDYESGNTQQIRWTRR